MPIPGSSEPLGGDAVGQFLVCSRVWVNWVSSPTFFEDLENFRLRISNFYPPYTLTNQTPCSRTLDCPESVLRMPVRNPCILLVEGCCSVQLPVSSISSGRYGNVAILNFPSFHASVVNRVITQILHDEIPALYTATLLHLNQLLPLLENGQ
jgi:hypothetical protein